MSPQVSEALTLSPAAKDAFWLAVEDCLVEIHGLPPHEAQRRCRDLRVLIESPPSGMSGEVFYHAEPFDVACDLAGQPLDITQHRRQYDPILDRHQW